MKAPYNYIVHTDKRYVNESESGLIVNTEITERDGEFVNRVGTVVAAPIYDELNIPVGSKVIVHHNTFRRWYDVRGNEVNGSAFWNENEYVVNQDSIYAYDSGDGWVSCDKYCFVKPIEERTGLLEERRNYYGIIAIGNDKSPPVGSKIAYTPNSEYTFYIDHEKLYRVYINDNCVLFNGLKEKETADTESL